MAAKSGHVFIECLRIIPEHVTSDTVLVFSHPIGGGGFLPAITQLARDGHHVLFVNTRYRGNDSALIMEKCLLDLGAGHQGREGTLRLLEGRARRLVWRRVARAVLPGAGGTHDGRR